MAKVTNAFTTYDATADREELSNTIFNIDPSNTPFMSALGTKNVSMLFRLANREYRR